MKRTISKEVVALVGEKVCVKGWVNSRRDHGGLIFIDLRDHSGIVQLTISNENSSFSLAESLRDEFVVSATGVVTEREESLKNPNIDTGSVEIVVEELTLLNKSEPLPFPLNDSQQANEELRLQYRFLDLRREKMQHMLKKRAEYFAWMRRYMEENEFIEITTPVLANSSPEGARDFLVPSRLHPGQFYALPQAPQQFKQLLMVGGIPRYYQMATCFRDEDPRADRLYGEFYQLDMEMSYVESGEDVRKKIEPLILDLSTQFAGKSLKFESVPRIAYQEAMDRYGSDKPDLRFDMEISDVSELVKDAEFGVFSSAVKNGDKVKAIVAPKTFTRSEIDALTDFAKSKGAGGLPYMKIEEGKATSAITKFFTTEQLAELVSSLQAKDSDTILFGVGKNNDVNKVLGALRSRLGDELGLKDPNVIALAWIIDFPFYEADEKTGELDFGHNPFSMPKNGPEEFDKEDKLEILADQYDMVMNGYEICSGGVRNYNPEVMYKAFGILGYSQDYVDEKFSAMINAFKYGAPPHAGCAFGIDRMFMELMGEDNIREIVAFPKNGSGVDVMTGSPGRVEEKQLKELSIALDIEE